MLGGRLAAGGPRGRYQRSRLPEGEARRVLVANKDDVTHTLRSTEDPVWISGGVTTVDELAWLDEAGAEGAVLGMALYTETMDPDVVAERWGGINEERKV